MGLLTHPICFSTAPNISEKVFKHQSHGEVWFSRVTAVNRSVDFHKIEESNDSLELAYIRCRIGLLDHPVCFSTAPDIVEKVLTHQSHGEVWFSRVTAANRSVDFHKIQESADSLELAYIRYRMGFLTPPSMFFHGFKHIWKGFEAPKWWGGMIFQSYSCEQIHWFP